ncbi:hypothetical protein EVJ58_g5744 [Rhodofomes roseus]|uniref:Phosphoketolase n=1 Tax=Rhodofomes roseus TaxID=34475 RepID=A0A4Y9YAA4_9APHY|nr:hypothetical protein EVJ58_g5744 [Rhodofomes roseus]
MIFLKSGILEQRDLTPDDIKQRLLGHWGTCPGLVLVYAHINRLIRKTDIDVLYVVGPGHGAPGILSCLWLESTLGHFWPHNTRDLTGLKNLISGFSVPGGFPSHVNVETPGSIHEGGELGYALSVAFGAVMDKPDLVCVCVVGDGEAETGPTATAWHGYKYLDPAESGAVLPIVHVNGFKISERTIYGTMDDKELVALFTGYGYQTRFIEDLDNIDEDMAASMDWALGEIHAIQRAARSGQPQVKPRWPVLILRTPKGWGGPKKLGDEVIEGSFHSHQVPLPGAKKDPQQLKLLQEWLRSYKPEELFDKNGVPNEKILSTIPQKDDKKAGMRKEVYAGYMPLDVPDWTPKSVERGNQESCMKVVGELLLDVMDKNPHTFRIFSPDELESNKLNATLRHSGRNMQWDVASRANGGRVIEILSEHTCQGMMQGYTLTGRTALFPSYEAFLGIVHTMMVQYSKFVKMAQEVNWRQPIGSLNYLETSTWARQEHNGFSHQNPSFIGAVLALKPQIARVYLPPRRELLLVDDGALLEGEELHQLDGWQQAADSSVAEPGRGRRAALLRQRVPQLRVRVVNVMDLMILEPFGTHPHALTELDFEALFTKDRPIHFNYHGYVNELKGLLFGRPNTHRVTMEGYREEGTTTSPFAMMLLNHTSRYHVAAAAVRGAAALNPRVEVDAHTAISGFMHEAQKAQQYIREQGEDPEGTFDVPKFE